MPQKTSAPLAKTGNGVGFAFLGLAILSYGGLWPVMRAGVEYLPPLWFATTRLFIGAVVLFAFLAATGRLRLPTRQDVPAILSVGICMMGFYVSLVHYAVQFVPAGRGALLGYLTPLFVTPIAVMFLGERMTLLRALGLALGLSGLLVLFNPAGFDWSDPDTLLGNGLCLLAAMLWSIAILQMRGHKWNLTPLQLGPWQLLLATLTALPFALFLEPRTDWTIGTPLIALVSYGGIVGTAVAMWAAASTIQKLGAVTASVGLLGGPVFALTISVLFQGEALTPTLLGGVVLILGGIALVTLAQKRAQNKASKSQ
jgi:drug/metabolite transporter (DMT)-like permease